MGRSAVVLAFLVAVLHAEEPTVSAIVSTIDFHPTGEPAAVGLRMLSRKDEPGWRALSALVVRLGKAYPRVARAAADALAEGPEPKRLEIVAATYSRTADDEVRRTLAIGLAYGYEAHRALLLRHLHENRFGAPDVLEVLAPKLEESELRRLLGIADLAPLAYAELRRRGLTVWPRELVVWARAIATTCLEKDACRAWADREPDFTVLSAVAMVLGDESEDVRDGAYGLLLTVSGKVILRDPELWNSWIAARRDRYEKPPPFSAGEIRAAVVRGARFVRRDVFDDGTCLWVKDRGGNHRIGSTALGVLALLAAGCEKDHPAIEKAVRETLVVFGPGGAPALRELADRGYETYVLSLLALALCELDAPRYEVPLAALHKRLLYGLQPSGGWGYQCLMPTDQGKPGRPDNSCTQYAVLALRELQRHGFKTPPEDWTRIGARFLATVNGHGGWNYEGGHNPTPTSMAAAGISSLAICFEAIHGRNAAARIRAAPRLARARSYLGRMLMEGVAPRCSGYTFYGIERACILTGIDGFASKHRTFDWYTEGARVLIGRQRPDGSTPGPGEYGPTLDTAYAILFLARATRTIGGSTGETVRVELPPERDQPPPPPVEEKKEEPPPPPPRLDVEWQEVPTRLGEATIVGKTDAASLTVDGAAVQPDARGRFFVPLTITKRREVKLVARGRNGVETERTVLVRFDTDAPRVELLGPPARHVGKQVLVFRANEPLRALRVAGRVYPADGPIVRAAVEVGEGDRALTWVATDRAGNEGRGQRDVTARNRHLVLDGKSALGIDLRRYRPAHLTVECWARSGAPHDASIVANTENSGFSLAWGSRQYPFPHGLVRVGNAYAAAGASRAVKWDQWNHLAVTYDGKAARFFVNGRLHSTIDAPGTHAASQHWLYIGGEPDRHWRPNHFFAGEVDEVRVSDVARYTDEFRPERSFMRDEHTLVLFHFDLLATLDDSGLHNHAWALGEPRLAGPALDADVLAYARDEMRRELPPAVPVPLTAEQRAEQDRRAGVEARKHLALVATTVRFVSPQGVGHPGLSVRAFHEALDVSDGPVRTDANGDATLHLPRGPWRVDFATAEMNAGRAVFGRATFAVREPGRHEVVLDSARQVEFRTREGELRAAHDVRLAWPDFSFHERVVPDQGRLEILTTGEAPLVLQAVRRPDERGGYLLRRPVGPGRTVVATEPEDATVHTFQGKGARLLQVLYTSADALPVHLEFATKKNRDIAISGVPDVVLHLESEHGGRRFRFYPRPYLADGKPIAFTGAPRFDVGVGTVRNWREQYKERINSLSFRVFLTTKTGLLLRPEAPYSIAWDQVVDGAVRFSGKTRPCDAVMTAPLDPKLLPTVRYRLQVRGPGFNQKLEVAPFEQTEVVHVGRVFTRCFPAVAPNARHWSACVERAMQAYEQTCPHGVGRMNIDLSAHMPLPIIGMGGGGWMWLPEHSLYGFWGTWYWTGLLCHELGHNYGYFHSNPIENRIMVQAGRRAGRRLYSIRPGMERTPEGNRYRALLDAVTEGKLEYKTPFPGDDEVVQLVGDAAGAGVLVPNLELTGEDAVMTWFYRCQFGAPAEKLRREFAGAWSWRLTLDGFDDEEIQIAMLQRAAGTPLGWLARLRGIVVHDYRLEDAAGRLPADWKELAGPKTRGAVKAKWRDKQLGADLAAEEREMRAELGHRHERVRALLRIAREHFARREEAAGERTILAAMAEARRGGDPMLDTALLEAALFWLAR